MSGVQADGPLVVRTAATRSSLNLSDADHAAVLRAAVDGDDEALQILVRLYQEQLRRFSRRVCRSDADADDAVQEAFAKLAKRPDVQRDRSSLAWLFAVVRNACLRFLRSLTRRRLAASVELDEVPATDLSPEELLERHRVGELVRSAIAQLDAPYREVMILRDLEGLSGAQVCASLQISEAAMKSRLMRARTSVRKTLKPYLRAE
jgi:RNA polymerase sigma-70 factor (ECF subfamily)